MILEVNMLIQLTVNLLVINLTLFIYCDTMIDEMTIAVSNNKLIQTK